MLKMPNNFQSKCNVSAATSTQEHVNFDVHLKNIKTGKPQRLACTYFLLWNRAAKTWAVF